MSFIGKMFSAPKAPSMPPPPAPPPPPVRQDAEVAAEGAADALRKRRGRASTELTGGEQGGTATDPLTTGAKVLGQ